MFKSKISRYVEVVLSHYGSKLRFILLSLSQLPFHFSSPQRCSRPAFTMAFRLFKNILYFWFLLAVGKNFRFLFFSTYRLSHRHDVLSGMSLFISGTIFRSTYLEHSFVSLFYFDVFSLIWLLCFSFRGISFCALHHYSTLGGRNGLVLTGPERMAEFEPSASPLCRFGLPLWLRSLVSISQRCASFLSAPW